MAKQVTSRFVLRGDNQLNSAFTRAQQQMAQLGRQAALFGAVAVAAGTAIVRSQAKQIDALAKTADALGITTENLQTLRTMAELSGVDVVKFDKALAKMQKTIGEVARRGGDMALAITDMGLSVEDVMALPADKQFEVVAKALGSVENASVRASIANDLFGRDAQKLLKLTDQLAREGLAPMRDELEALGFLISRSDAAGVERMNDSMLLASRVGQGLAQQFTVALAPAIAAIAEEFTDAAKESDGFKDEVQATVDGVVSTLGFVLDVTDSVGRAFKLAANAGIIGFESLKGTIWGVADSIINGPNRALDSLLDRVDALPGIDIDFRFGELAPQLRKDLNISTGIIAEAKAEIDALLLEPLPSAAIMERLARVRAELATAAAAAADSGQESSGTVTIISPEEKKRLEQIKSSLAGLLAQVREFGLDDSEKALLKLVDLGADESQIAQARMLLDELRIQTEEQEAIKAATKAKLDMEQEYANLVAGTRTDIEQHAALIERINELFAAGIIPNGEAYGDLIRRLNEEFQTGQDKLKDKTTELDEFAKQAARNMETALADFLFDPFDEGLDGMIEGFGRAMQRLAAEAAAAAIMKAIFGGGEDGDANSGFASFLGSLLGGTRDSGGRGYPGKAYVINPKAGPEVFIPDTAGTFIPNYQQEPANRTFVQNVNLPPLYSRQTAMQVAQESHRRQQIAAARNF